MIKRSDPKSKKGRTIMQNEYTAVLKQDGDWWIGWIEEVPGVNCQERTYEELKQSLEVTLTEILSPLINGTDRSPRR